jgi:hypothetical protein
VPRVSLTLSMGGASPGAVAVETLEAKSVELLRTQTR